MRLLIIGSLNGQLTLATKMAMAEGAKVVHADTVAQALQVLNGGTSFDLVMVDVTLEVADLVTGINRARIHLDVVACGIDPDAEVAVAAIKAGAKEYIPLPPEPELIAAILKAVASESADVVYADPKSQALIDLAEQIAPSDATVLITGESGVGKEVFAKHIHAKSRRANAPFISLNCAAIPEQLLESELFGHEKGAFTGAISRRIGKFEEADGGTLLLDEISEMDLRLQAKLLRALQERVIDRVGGNKSIPVNIRILATSNRDLMRAVAENSFREDLYYRLNVVNLAIPPLRERPQDIIVLARHFARKYAKINGFPSQPLTPELEEVLMNAHWQGNVRELENAMHRAVLLSGDNAISETVLNIPLSGAAPQAGFTASSHAAQMAAATTQNMVGRTVADVERELILDTLDHCLGNRTHASNILGISIRTLRNKLNQYTDAGLEVTAPGGQRATPAYLS
ncbi:MAG: sigma-54 dependent transcriptional regulator [Hyphomicrobiales bacterium]